MNEVAVLKSVLPIFITQKSVSCMLQHNTKEKKKKMLYLNDNNNSPSRNVSSLGLDLLDLVRVRRSLSSDRSKIIKFLVTLFILFSLTIKIYALIVFFSRMEVQLLLHVKDKNEPIELFKDFITDFSFPEMVHDFWKAKAYLVATVIILGSALVPISKHIYLLFCWLFPISLEWENFRRRILFFFDQTGRTALVDLFLLGYVICIFYTDIVLVLGDGYSIEIKLSGLPVKGIFLGIFSTFSAAFLSHYLLLVHDEQMYGEFSSQITISPGDEVASLMNRLYASSFPLHRKRLYNFFIILLLISSTVVFGFVINHFIIVSFHLEGLAGFVANEKWRDFTLLTAAWNMPKNSPEINGSRFLSILHVFLVLVVPIGLLVASYVLWFTPLNLRPQRRLLQYFPFWLSWSCLDVFLITSFASYLEMHLIAEFIFDKNFSDICTVVRDIFHIPCVALGHEENIGLYLLLIVSFLFFLLSTILNKIGNSLLLEGGVDNRYRRLDQSPSFHFFANWEANASPLLQNSITNEFVRLGSIDKMINTNTLQNGRNN